MSARDADFPLAHEDTREARGLVVQALHGVFPAASLVEVARIVNVAMDEAEDGHLDKLRALLRFCREVAATLEGVSDEANPVAANATTAREQGAES
jgi:hypothetical protein